MLGAQTRRVRVGIVSFAHMHAHDYAVALSNLGNKAEFVGVTDEDEARGQSAANKYGVDFAGVADQLYEEAEAVVICSESRDHARLVIDALEQGVHVLCEKPIATTVSEARSMVDAAGRSGKQLRIAFPCRYLAAIQRAKEIIEAGSIGRVLAISGTNHGRLPGGWFMDLEAAGGGAVMDHTVHLADLYRWMLHTEIESVYAEVGSVFSNGIIDDSGILTLDLSNGAFATIDPSWSRGNSYPTWGDVTLKITGTNGVVNLDAFAHSIAVYDHEFCSTEWHNTGGDMNQAMLEDFVDGLRHGSPGGANALDGLRALEVAVAAYESAYAGEPKCVERTTVSKS